MLCRLYRRGLVESGIASKHNGRMVKRGKRRKRVVQKPKRPLTAPLVQLGERWICNPLVGGSSPSRSSRAKRKMKEETWHQECEIARLKGEVVVKGFKK